MNQDLMLRLFRSIEGDKEDDVIKVASLIIEDEKLAAERLLLAEDAARRCLRSLETAESEGVSPFRAEIHIGLRDGFHLLVLQPRCPESRATTEPKTAALTFYHQNHCRERVVSA